MILADVVEMYEPVAAEAGQNLSLAAEPNLALWADRDLLFQVLDKDIQLSKIVQVRWGGSTHMGKILSVAYSE